MSDQPNIQMSHGLVVLPPKSDQAYPIPCEEWRLLKSKIQKLTTEPWVFHTVGSLLLGAALSAIASILLQAFDSPEQQRALDTAWSIFAVTGLCGVACLFFAHKERQMHRDRASEVVAQMDLIEKRYERGVP